MLDLARPFAAVEARDGAKEIAVAHQLDHDIGVVAGLGHGDVEMLHPLADVGDDLGELGLAVGGRLPSANTRTGLSYFRMRSTRPAR